MKEKVKRTSTRNKRVVIVLVILLGALLVGLVLALSLTVDFEAIAIQQTVDSMVATREHMEPSRTAIALTRDPLILSRTPVPVLLTLTEQARLITPVPDNVRFELTATQFVVGLIETVAAGGKQPLSRYGTPMSLANYQETATAYILGPTQTATALGTLPPLPGTVVCTIHAEGLDLHRDLLDIIRESLESKGIYIHVSSSLVAYELKAISPNQGKCGPNFTNMDVRLQLHSSSRTEIAVDLVEILSELDEQFIEESYDFVHLEMSWWLERMGMYGWYVLKIDTEYLNAMRAYREGLRGDELIEALGGLVPYYEEYRG